MRRVLDLVMSHARIMQHGGYFYLRIIVPQILDIDFGQAAVIKWLLVNHERPAIGSGYDAILVEVVS
jgi:hypothetical protein